LPDSAAVSPVLLIVSTLGAVVFIAFYAMFLRQDAATHLTE
jgi:hypothetical protein